MRISRRSYFVLVFILVVLTLVSVLQSGKIKSEEQKVFNRANEFFKERVNHQEATNHQKVANQKVTNQQEATNHQKVTNQIYEYPKFPKYTFFDSPSVREFRQKYLDKKFVISDSSVAFLIRGHNAGFTSYLNNALNLFIWAFSHGVPFHFHVQKDDWAHISWLEFFNDFSEGSDCPIILEIERDDAIGRHMWGKSRWKEWEKNVNGPFFINTDNGLPSNMDHVKSSPSNKHYFVRPFGENWNTLLGFAASWEGQSLIDLKTKGLAAKAIWDPKAYIRKAIHAIEIELLGSPGAPFLSIQIRKGDKLRLEASDIAITRFVTQTVNVINGMQVKPLAIFVFSDDVRAIKEYKRLVRQEKWSFGIPVFDINDAIDVIDRKKIYGDFSGFVLRNMTGYEHWDFMKWDEEPRRKLTLELVTTLSLASKSKALICTASSNMCRFMALLMGDDATLITMEGQGWNNL